MGSDLTPDPDLSFPELKLELVEDVSPECPPGFLRLVRRRLRLGFPDGTASQEFVYDEVDRRGIDAVVIAAHFERQHTRWVYLRSAVRPPMFFRDPGRSPLARAETGAFWELPAGLIEAGEQTEGGVFEAARRELLEELGFEVATTDFRELGHSTVPCPGVIAERHFFVSVEVDPDTRGQPSLDGSALERFGRVISLPVDRAIELCRAGRIENAATELGLRRLADLSLRSPA